MQKIIISLMVLLMTPLIVQADHHATPGPGEGSFYNIDGSSTRRLSLY